MNGWVLAWSGACVTAICASVWRVRRLRRELDDWREKSLQAIGDAQALQVAIDRAWDAAHEFGDEPQVALSVVCEYLEPLVTPAPGPTDDELSEWLREERW